MRSLISDQAKGGASSADQRRVYHQWLVALQHHLRSQLTTSAALQAAEQLECMYVELRDL